VRRLHDQGLPVVAAVRNPLGAALVHASAPDCDIRVGGLSRSGGKHLLDDCDVIINCALAGSGGNPRAAYSRNRALVDGVLEAKSLRWFVHFSTVAIFGELLREFRDERDAFEHPNPESEYGRSKLYVERYAGRRGRERGVKTTLLRLGHVYGPGLYRSREIIELARDPHFRLPFAGRYPANAIHLDTVAESIIALLASDPQRETFSFAEQQHTWRDIFDWHTSSLGLAPVQAMSEDESLRAREVYTRSSVPRDVAGWMRGLPIKRLVRSPAIFDVALRVLVRTPQAITTRVTNLNKRIGARGSVAATLGARRQKLPELYLSAGMPGPFLDLAVEANAAEHRARDLRDWFHGWSRPRMGRARAAAAPPRQREAIPLTAERAGAGDGR
jgi:nucleoside-diphosphate-sugar epimerase